MFGVKKGPGLIIWSFRMF